MLTVWLDDFTPCLKDSVTGDLVETEVLRVQQPAFLRSIIRKTAGTQNGMSCPGTMKSMRLLLPVR
jgi:hypothetical protein